MKGRLGFSAIKGNKERLPKKKIYCQNRKMVCHYLQLEDSEVQELLFLLIRRLFFFFFELQITACMLSAHSQCLSATGEMHHGVFSFHWAGIFVSSIIHITACCSDSRKTSKEPCPPVRKKKGI